MTYNSPLNAARLLISVRTAEEAVTAAKCQVPWIDVKNPASGSLGMPEIDTGRHITAQLAAYPGTATSVALGELLTLDIAKAPELMKLFTIGKIGLSDCAQIDHDDLLDRLRNLRRCFPAQSHLVPAIYADSERARSPDAKQVVRLAQHLKSPYLLIDTWHKDGRGLFHWCSVDAIKALADQCACFGVKLVVAGSLRTADWPALERLDDVIIGVRGAVCRTSSDRTSELCSDKVMQWQAWCASSSAGISRAGTSM